MNKVDYTMSSIVGIDGLDPTLKIIKYTKIIAIANKEAIICAWIWLNKNWEEIKQSLYLWLWTFFFMVWFKKKQFKYR